MDFRWTFQFSCSHFALLHISANFWAGGKSTSAPLMDHTSNILPFLSASIHKLGMLQFTESVNIWKWFASVGCLTVPWTAPSSRRRVSASLYQPIIDIQVQRRFSTAVGLDDIFPRNRTFFFKLSEIHENSLVYWPKGGCVRVEPLDWQGKPIKAWAGAYNGGNHSKTAPGKGCLGFFVKTNKFNAMCSVGTFWSSKVKQKMWKSNK